MAKKKAKATSKKSKATKKKVTKKAVARGKKKIVKKAPKKTVKKAVRKGIKKAVTKAVGQTEVAAAYTPGRTSPSAAACSGRPRDAAGDAGTTGARSLRGHDRVGRRG